MHKLFEDAAAVLVILKLVEAGAGGSEQDNIAGARGVSGGFDGAVEGSGLLDGHTASDLLFDFVRGGANQKREDGFFPQWGLQHGIVAAFVFSTQNNQDAAGKSVERFQGGVDIGGF